MFQRSRMFQQWCFVLALFTFGAAIPANAALGDTVSSVQSDAQRLKASVKVQQAANYTVHELQGTGGTTVREYVSPQGQVFAVAWEGPVRPDLQKLLGPYYQQAVQAVQASKAQRVGRHPISIQEPNLVVQMGGRQRAFFGRAYVPDMVPSAVRHEEIR